MLLELFLWLLLGSITLGGAVFVFGVTWSFARQLTRRAAPTVIVRSSGQQSMMLRNDPAVIVLIWSSFLVLVPVLLLAVWATMVEIRARTIGAGLVLSVVHLVLVWQLVRIGTRVQRVVEISRNGLVARPVIGRSRELRWDEITHIEDVRYVGPGVSGLYVRSSTGMDVVLDAWLPDRDFLRSEISRRAPRAEWTEARRGIVVG